LFKRVVDCLLSSALFVLTLPLLALAALAIWLEDRGPVIYRQRRVGLRGEVFSLFKLRSMNIAAEDDGPPQWSTKQDGRVTRVGRIIRRLRVDEIPQLINILRGEMSFVGPRPERPYFVERLAQENSFYLDRHSVKPGLTGWAQVNFAYGSSAGDARRKLEYDLFYIRYGDILLDIVVILQTVRVVLWPQSVERSEWA
jgi:lipopolysaccharide/colanic/teichoic acid biosynthesis glycosyltransferase